MDNRKFGVLLPVGVLQLFAVSGRNLGLNYLPKQTTGYFFCWGKATGSEDPLIVAIKNAVIHTSISLYLHGMVLN